MAITAKKTLRSTRANTTRKAVKPTNKKTTTKRATAPAKNTHILLRPLRALHSRGFIRVPGSKLSKTSKKLPNQRAKWALFAVFVALFGLIGAYYLSLSHAATAQKPLIYFDSNGYNSSYYSVNADGTNQTEQYGWFRARNNNTPGLYISAGRMVQSNKGAYVAIAGYDYGSGSQGLFVQPTSESTLRPTVLGNVAPQELMWNDGDSRLAFTVSQGRACQDNCYYQSKYSVSKVYTFNPSTRKLALVTTLGDEFQGATFVGWKDNNTLVYVYRDKGNRQGTPGPVTLHHLNVATKQDLSYDFNNGFDIGGTHVTERKCITSTSRILVASDGTKKIGVICNSEDRSSYPASRTVRITTMNIDGTNRQEIASIPKTAADTGVWRRGGQQVAFVTHDASDISRENMTPTTLHVYNVATAADRTKDLSSACPGGPKGLGSMTWPFSSDHFAMNCSTGLVVVNRVLNSSAFLPVTPGKTVSAWSW